MGPQHGGDCLTLVGPKGHSGLAGAGATRRQRKCVHFWRYHLRQSGEEQKYSPTSVFIGLNLGGIQPVWKP